jgi:phage terminase Nu1 subunit (DNA packaging protein)
MATKAELAGHLFTSEQNLDDLRKLGVVPMPRGRAGYDLDVCRRMYIEHLRTRARSPAPAPDETAAAAAERLKTQDDLMTERARLAAEQANRAAMENAVRRRELAPVSLLQTYSEQVGSVVRQGLEALPAQLKRRIPHLRSSEINIIRQEVARTSDAIASFDTSHESPA